MYRSFLFENRKSVAEKRRKLGVPFGRSMTTIIILQPIRRPSMAGPATSKKDENPKGKSRISFSSWQLSILEANFAQQQYITQVRRVIMANYLGISEMQVKVWYQNRRIRWRRDMKLSHSK